METSSPSPLQTPPPNTPARRRVPKLNPAELRARLYRRRYLVPNAVTLGNMFCGFLCIIYASSERFEKAAMALAIALLLDGLDGKVARKLNATSKFGVEFDSFSDVVSFGIAPAMLMYHWCFKATADEFGVFVTFIFALCAASRLARFNISAENLKAFTGLPTPGAAAMVASLVHLSPYIQPTPSFIGLISGLMLVLAGLMVSHIEFFSVKTVRLQRSRLRTTIPLGAIIALIWYHSGVGFFVLASLYVLSGPFLRVRRRREPIVSSTKAPSASADDRG